MPKTSSKKKTKAKKATGKTLVTFLLDRSYSMNGLKSQTLEAFNAYVGELRGSKTDVRLSLVYFDHHDDEMSLDRQYVGKKIEDVPPLMADDYVPRGMTPLLDAAGATIQAVEKSLKGRDDVKVVIVIQTDGFENKSVEVTNAALRAVIKEKQDMGWQFLFMGAGIDAYGQAGRLGLLEEQTLSYSNDREATKAAFASTAQNTRAFAEGIATSTAYTTEQKMKAGDVHDKSHSNRITPEASPVDITHAFRLRPEDFPLPPRARKPGLSTLDLSREDNG